VTMPVQIIILGVKKTPIEQDQVWSRDNTTGIWTQLPALPSETVVQADYRMAIHGTPDGKIIVCSRGGPKHYVDGSWTQRNYGDAPGDLLPECLHSYDHGYDAVYGAWPRSLIMGQAYPVKWNGAWGQIPYPAPDDRGAKKVWMASATEVWACGGDGVDSALWHTTNHTEFGESWTNLFAQMNSDCGISATYAENVWGFAANDVYIIVSTFGAGGEYLIHWNGSVFSISATLLGETNRLWQGLWGWDNTHLFLTGGVYGGPNEIYMWDGATLNLVHTITTWDPSDWYAYRIGGLPDGSYLLCQGAMGSAIESVDGGVTWQAPDASYPSVFVFGGGWTYRHGGMSFIGALPPPPPIPLCTYGGGQYGVPEPPYGQCLEAETPDVDPPYLQNQSPAPSQTGVLLNANVVLEIVDDDSGVNASTVEITVAGVVAWSGDAQQAGFSVTKSTVSGGFRYVIDPDVLFSSFQLVEVGVYAEDVAANVLDTTYSFRAADVLGPLVEPIDPINQQTGVPLSSLVSLRISDEDSVVASTIKIRVDRGTGVFLTAFDWMLSPKFRPGFDGPGSNYTVDAGVYTIVIDPITEFPTRSVARIEVQATDPSGNLPRL